MGDTPPLALAAPAGVGQGQGVFVSKHSKAIQKRRNHSMNTTSSVTRIHPSPKQPQQKQTAKEVIAANVLLLALRLTYSLLF